MESLGDVAVGVLLIILFAGGAATPGHLVASAISNWLDKR